MKIHLIGVGGVAMGNLAAMFQKEGHQVSGSDRALYPPMSDRLADWGIDVKEFDEKNIGSADLYIIGNAISRGNPEVEKILNQKLPFESMAGALRRFFLQGKEVVVVAGTHGKTTTTFLIDHILQEAGERPGLFVGGVRGDGMEGFRNSNSRFFVIEGDEYDTAFFDKHPKFIHYNPRYLVLTSVEFDHADIYRDRFDYERSFRRLLRLIPSEGLVAACADDPGVRRVLDGFALAPVEWYGKEKGKKGKKEKSGGMNQTSFQRDGRDVLISGAGRVDDFSLIGDHNTANATAAWILGRRMGIPPEIILRAFRTFPGVLRRQQIRREISAARKSGAPVTLMEDFAHHPTAVKETLRAVKEAYPGRKVHVLFEPRSATSYRNIFQKEYSRAFRGADSVFICEVYDRKKVEAPERLDVKKLIRDIQTGSPKTTVGYGKDPAKLRKAFEKSFKPSRKGDLILVLSNGAFGGIYQPLEAFLDALL